MENQETITRLAEISNLISNLVMDLQRDDEPNDSVEEMLEYAESNASNENQKIFIHGLRAFYGSNGTLSPKQLSCLQANCAQIRAFKSLPL